MSTFKQFLFLVLYKVNYLCILGQSFFCFRVSTRHAILCIQLYTIMCFAMPGLFYNSLNPYMYVFIPLIYCVYVESIRTCKRCILTPHTYGRRVDLSIFVLLYCCWFCFVCLLLWLLLFFGVYLHNWNSYV